MKRSYVVTCAHNCEPEDGEGVDKFVEDSGELVVVGFQVWGNLERDS